MTKITLSLCRQLLSIYGMNNCDIHYDLELYLLPLLQLNQHTNNYYGKKNIGRIG